MTLLLMRRPSLRLGQEATVLSHPRTKDDPRADRNTTSSSGQVPPADADSPGTDRLRAVVALGLAAPALQLVLRRREARLQRPRYQLSCEAVAKILEAWPTTVSVFCCRRSQADGARERGECLARGTGRQALPPLRNEDRKAINLADLPPHAMSRIEAWLYHQASAPRQPHLYRPAGRRRCLFRYSGNFHRHELRRFPFANTLLPVVKLPIAKTTIATKRRHCLPARNLFGNQPAPLRPFFRLSALHPFTLRHDEAIYKMGPT